MPDESLIVQTRYGPVRGLISGSVVEWRGIPYAAPPVGARRFRRPAPPESWDEPRDATAYGPSPVQPPIPQFAGGPGRAEQDEDCLTVNVVRPAGEGGQKWPVMVWIYGGGFVFGASRAYDASDLAARGNVLVVTLNYRVGAFGFLDATAYATAEHQFDSNNGLRDQVAALTWVRDNIAAFGGDPANVTLFGESAGGISVTTLMCVPEARGLFHRAIAQSSSPSAVFDRTRAQRRAAQFVDLLGAPDDDIPADAEGDADALAVGDAEDVEGGVANRLLTASAKEIRDASAALSQEVPERQDGAMAFTPVVDGEFVPVRPLDAFRSGDAARIPLIIGSNAAEGGLFALFERFGITGPLPTSAEDLEQVFDLMDPGARDRIVETYPGYPSTRSVAQIAGDIAFWYPSVQVADAHSAFAPAWVYRFDYAPPSLRLFGLRATHAAELRYVFGRSGSSGGLAQRLPGPKEAGEVSDRVITRWSTFADSRDPGEGWPRYDTATRAILIIDRDDRVEHDPRAGQRRAWESSGFWEDGTVG